MSINFFAGDPIALLDYAFDVEEVENHGPEVELGLYGYVET